MRISDWSSDVCSSDLQPTSLVADAHLQPVAGGGWKSVGERACFALSPSLLPGGMPAGWYWVTGRLQVSAGMVAAPCLYPSYAKGADGDAKIPLRSEEHMLNSSH